MIIVFSNKSILFSDMSTLTTIETSNTNLILHNLQSSSQYFISVSICNSFDCGSSSVAIDIKTPPSSILKFQMNKKK